MAMPYLALATVGLAIEFRMWLIIRRSAALTTKPLAITSAGLGLCILGIAVVRESIRIHALDMEALSASHARAASVGGFWAFAAFLVLNAVLIWWSLQLVRKATPMEPGSR
jgi:uncharacterized membrane protein